MVTVRRLLERLSRELPARDIRHNGRPYLRRYYLGTICGVRFYLHHFIDSDPDGLHNHPWRFGGSIILSGYYYEERRFARGPDSRKLRAYNIVNGDTLHRVVVPEHLRAVVPYPDSLDAIHYAILAKGLGVWSLFFHTRKCMRWATLKDKGAFIQYVEETKTFAEEDGHSTWWRTAPKGKELFKND